MIQVFLKGSPVMWPLLLTSIVKSKGLPVNLPVAASGEQQNRDDFTSITITESNEILVNKQPVTPEGLIDALQKLKAENPDPKIFINGDEKSLLGRTILVLDDVQKCGISKIAFEISPKAK